MTPQQILESKDYRDIEWKEIFSWWEKWCSHLRVLSVSFEKKHTVMGLIEQTNILCDIISWFDWLSYTNYFWLPSDFKEVEWRVTLTSLGSFERNEKEAFRNYIKPKINSMVNDIKLYEQYFNDK